MTPFLTLLAVTLPLLLALGYAKEKTRPHLPRMLPLAALPALALPLAGSEEALVVPWLLEGGLWGLDALRRPFLAFTALVWLVAGLFAFYYFRRRGRTSQFALFWLLSMSGNFGLILAQDIASFFTFFSLMTFAAYGLVVHWRTPEARYAGLVYLVMSLVGEMALLAGLMMAAAPAGLTLIADIPAAVAASPHRDGILALLLAGFGVKAGAPLLHMWLPLAHPAAPSPASAVLSGVMIKAGLLGWLLTLPLGEEALPRWSAGLIGAGLLAAFGAALAGLCQRQAKAVLAYSSVSQMGLMIVLLGIALAAPAHAEGIAAVAALYAMHHGLAKASLFLAAGSAAHAGHWPRPLFWLLVFLPGLSLAGLPLTSGAAAKEAFKDVLKQVGEENPAMAGTVETLLGVAAVGTTLLVLRFLWRLRDERGKQHDAGSLVLGWALAVLASLLAFWLLPRPPGLAVLATGLAHPLDSLWPILAGLALAAAARVLRLRAAPVPPGDVLALFESSWVIVQGGAMGAARFSGLFLVCAGAAVKRAGSDLLAAGSRLAQAESFFRAHSALAFMAALVALLVLSLIER